MPFQPSSHVEQIAQHIRVELLKGRWSGQMPGALKLEQEVGASHTIIDRALRLLEKEGWLENLGPGRRRRIIVPKSRPAGLRVRILNYDRPDAHLNQLLDRLHQSGHQAAFADKSMHELGMDLKRITRFVKQTQADAWVVVAGSMELLAWFAKQDTPALALYGRSGQVDIASASPRKLPAITSLVQKLVDLGHERIVGILRAEHRKPTLGAIALSFQKQLESNGISTGPYNIPDWDDTPQDLQRLLDSLFEHTPPTALLIDEPALLLAARDHLAHRGICAPEEVSLACFDALPAFDWQLPVITHVAWDPTKIIRPVASWVNQVAKGNPHQRTQLVDSELVLGGTIGPVPA